MHQENLTAPVDTLLLIRCPQNLMNGAHCTGGMIILLE